MKGTNDMKKPTKKTKKPVTKFWVVSWADYDYNSEVLTNGTLTDIYSSLEKAHDAVMALVKDAAKDAADNYEDWQEVYDVPDMDSLLKKMVLRDTKDFVAVRNPDTGTDSQYAIVCFSTKYVK